MNRVITSLLIAAAITSCVPSKQYNDLKATQEKCEKQRQDLTNENRKLKASNDEFAADLESLSKKFAQLKSDTIELGQRIRQTQIKQVELDSRNKELLNRLKNANDQGSKENRKLVDILRDTQEDLLKREDRLRDLERQLNAKEKRLADLEIELQKREARVKELEAIIAEKDAAVRALKDRIANALLGFKDKGLTVEQRNGKIYVSLEAKLLFPSGSTVINADGKQALIDLSEVIRDEKDITILVEGHTDTDPYNGSGAIKDNWDLSVMRATSVVKIMTNEGKVDQNMLTAAGRGEYVPIAPNNTAEGKAKNRRIEIILTPNLDKLFEIINE
ncbi:MAG: OmpA family protein [Salibacteraceae bacterium]